MKMENFQPQNIEPKKEVNSETQKEKSNLAKNARNLLVATGVALSALVPGKSEAQKIKEIEPIIVHDKNDPRLKTYNDSLYIHNKTEYLKNDLFNYLKTLPKYEERLYDGTILKGYKVDSNNSVLSNKYNKYVSVTNAFGSEKNVPIVNWDKVYSVYEKDKGWKIDPTVTFKKPVQKVIYKPETKKVADKDTTPPVEEMKTVVEEKTPETKTILGTFNIKGKVINYYSEEQKNDILNKLKKNNVVVNRVGDSQNYTVSRFYDGNIEEF